MGSHECESVCVRAKQQCFSKCIVMNEFCAKGGSYFLRALKLSTYYNVKRKRLLYYDISFKVYFVVLQTET